MTNAAPVPNTPSATTAAIGPETRTARGRRGDGGDQQHERARRHHRGDDAERPGVGEPVLDDEAPDRVADARQHDREATEERRR